MWTFFLCAQERLDRLDRLFWASITVFNSVIFKILSIFFFVFFLFLCVRNEINRDFPKWGFWLWRFQKRQYLKKNCSVINCMWLQQKRNPLVRCFLDDLIDYFVEWKKQSQKLSWRPGLWSILLLSTISQSNKNYVGSNNQTIKQKLLFTHSICLKKLFRWRCPNIFD